MSKLRFPVVSTIRFFRGLHTSAICSARGSKFPKVPVEFVENQVLSEERFAASSPKIDEVEAPVIELSKEDVIQELKQQNLQDKQRQSANDAMPPFEKLPETDTSLGVLMMSSKKNSRNEPSRFVVLEGRRLVEDAFDAGLKGHSVYFSQKETVQGMQLPEKCKTKFFKVPFKNLKLWSTVDSCPGITGFFKHPKPPVLESFWPKNEEEGKLPINLVCDNIRDPGNMGSILRVAAGVGCNQVILTKGCVNVWDNKVLRGSMGSIFRLPVIQRASWESIQDLILAEDASVYVADSKCPTEGVVNYSDVEYGSTEKPIVLVLGGETCGISREAFALLKSAQHGFRVHIPLTHGVESLNVSGAAAVLLFEIRRQWLSKNQLANRALINQQS